MFFEDTDVPEVPETPVVEMPKKRGRGRPKGSKNRKGTKADPRPVETKE